MSKPVSKLSLSGFVITVSMLLMSGCGDDDIGAVSPEPATPVKPVKEPPVVEWYPTPKHSHQPRYFIPEQATPRPVQQPQVATQRVQQQPVWGGYVQQQPVWGGYVQPAPQQVWVVPTVPPQGSTYAPAPSWGQPVQPYPQQTQPQPQQQTYYIQAPQPGYAQRPWGETNEQATGNRAGQSINTWQTTNELPAWGVPAYGGYQMQAPGYYTTQPGIVQPGTVQPGTVQPGYYGYYR